MNEDDRDEINARFAALEERIEKLEAKLAAKKKAAPAAAHAQTNGAAHPAGITDGTGKSLVPTTTQSKRVAAIFHRRLTTPWSAKEIKAYKQLGTIPEADLAVVEAYYKSGALYLRRDLQTFLNNFRGEVDRAYAWQKEESAPPAENLFSNNGRVHQPRMRL